MKKAEITKLEDGYYVELNGFGKSFPVCESYDWAKCYTLAESWAAYIEIFTNPERSLVEFQKTFQKLKRIVDAVREDFPFEGSQGFSDGDFTFFAVFEEAKIGVQFGALNIYLDKDDFYIVEHITNFYPKRTAIVCSGVTEDVVVQILKNSPCSRSYLDPTYRFRQLYLSKENIQYFNDNRQTD